MGCDIHEYFETRQPDGRWLTTFTPMPNRWWYEDVVDDKIDDGSAQTIFGEPDETKARVLVEEYLKGLDISTPEGAQAVIERYSHHPRFSFEFRYPDGAFDPKWGSAPIGDRNYEWFGAIADGIRGYNGAFPIRGVPDDCCREIASEMKRWQGDGHSHSWLMLREIFDEPSLQKFTHQMNWLRSYVPDPDNTRMVFFFDN
jgi:hypothetical protein